MRYYFTFSYATVIIVVYGIAYGIIFDCQEVRGSQWPEVCNTQQLLLLSIAGSVRLCQRATPQVSNGWCMISWVFRSHWEDLPCQDNFRTAYIYICVYIYMHMYMYVFFCIYAYTHIHTHIYIYARMHVYVTRRYWSPVCYRLRMRELLGCSWRLLVASDTIL